MKKLVLKILFGTALIFATGSQVWAQEDANEKVKTWSQAAATDILRFDHSNYQQRKEENKKYFTESGFEGFYLAVETAQMPQKVENEKSALTAILKCSAVVTSAEDGNGWDVKFPIELTYKSETNTESVIHNVTLHVVEDSSSADGLGISQWLASVFQPTDTLPCATENSEAPAAPAAPADE